MSFFWAVFYGIVQGLTEFLPVSSSGHLSVMHGIFGIENPDISYFSFDILLHMATLAAVVIVYWRDIIPLVPAFFTLCKKVFIKIFTAAGRLCPLVLNLNERMCVLVIIATCPLVIAALMKDRIEAVSGSVKAVGFMLLLNAVLLFLSDYIHRGNKGIEKATPSNALIVGISQMFAVMPGLSRSGTTITAGITQGFSREFAVKFSFILSIPAILGANILNLPEMISTPVPQSDIFAYAAGMVAALLSGIAAMKLIIFISKRASFKIFSVYCVIIGVVALIFG